ncbi:MAG: S8 family serine peptidase [Nitrospirae bacterium]|nr:S8 family serine peptidase [Nitrospirota bacterium]
MKSIRIFSKVAALIIPLSFSLLGCGSSSSISGIEKSGISADKKNTAEYMPGELLVKFRDGTSAITAEGLHSSINAVRKKVLKEIRVHQIKLPESVTVTEAVEHYQHDPNVEYAEPNYIIHKAAVPSDQYFNNLWGLNNTGQNGGVSDADIDAPEAWDITTGSHDVIIAVIDTGIASGHPDLSGNIWRNAGESNCADDIDNDGNGYIDDCNGWDFIGNDNDPSDYDGHGTHVSGTIAAQGNNSIGIAGIMWDAQIMPLRILGVSGSGTIADAASAILYANAKGARIINNSWGGSGYSQVLKDAVDASNALVVCAAGNNGTDNDALPFYPASYTSSNIISVAASDNNDMLAFFSNYGINSVDIAAPGVNIYSTFQVLTYGVPVTIYSEDFDGASGNLPLLGWNRGGTNSTWAVTGGTGVGGSNSLEDSPASNYLDNTSSRAWFNSRVFSEKDNRYTLSFQWKGVLERGADYLDINYSPDSINWDWTDYRTGSTNGSFLSYSTDFTSIAESFDSFYFGFGLSSNNSAIDDGVYIDNVSLIREPLNIGGYSYEYESGASMAAPHVSGVAGLIFSLNPSLSSLQAKEIILNTADLKPSMSGRTLTGGRLNAYNAALHSVQLNAPSGLNAAAASSSTINLTWADNSNNETGFRIERKAGDEGIYSEIAAVGANVTGYNDAGLNSSTLYYYRIKAYNPAGSSSYSNEAGATTNGESSGGNGGGGGCSITAGADAKAVDILMALIPAAAVFMAIKRRKKSISKR